MSEVTKFTDITEDFINKNGVRALANYPNRNGSYGQAGLSPDSLKEWFDKLGVEIIKRLNELQTALNSSAAPKYIGVDLDNDNYGSLANIISSFANGDFARDILKLKESEGKEGLLSLQSIINTIAQEISNLKETIDSFDDGKLDKYSGSYFENGQLYKVYAVDKSGTDEYLNISGKAVENDIPQYQTNGALPVGDPSEENHATPKSYVDEKINEMLNEQAVKELVEKSFNAAEGGEF